MVAEYQFGEDEEILEMDGGDDCTTMWKYSMTQMVRLKMFKREILCYLYFTTIVFES